LRLVEDDEGFLQRASAHIGQRYGLYDLVLAQVAELLRAQQRVESVVKRL